MIRGEEQQSINVWFCASNFWPELGSAHKQLSFALLFERRNRAAEFTWHGVHRCPNGDAINAGQFLAGNVSEMVCCFLVADKKNKSNLHENCCSINTVFEST